MSTGEERNRESQVSFQLSRQEGLFGSVTVYWEITSQRTDVNASLQLSPTAGSTIFQENINSEMITFTVKSDVVS